MARGRTFVSPGLMRLRTNFKQHYWVIMETRDGVYNVGSCSTFTTKRAARKRLAMLRKPGKGVGRFLIHIKPRKLVS